MKTKNGYVGVSIKRETMERLRDIIYKWMTKSPPRVKHYTVSGLINAVLEDQMESLRNSVPLYPEQSIDETSVS